MDNAVEPSTTTIYVFTRHTPTCKFRADRYSKRCNCRKALYIYEDGHDSVVSAKTRSWDQAERFAQRERDQRDPVKRRLQEIEDQEAQKLQLQTAKDITVTAATDRWLRSVKAETAETTAIYKRAAWRICTWAADQGIESVRGVTADALDEWRGTWSVTAEERYSRIGPTSQSHFQGRLRQFCRWCLATGFLDRDPTAFFKGISKGKGETQPLTATQFKELLDAIGPFTSSIHTEAKDFAKELTALFLFQRWAGLRILDCLMFPRTGLVGNRITLVTKKNHAKIESRTVPDCVVSALLALTPDRPSFRPGHFFWQEGKKWEGLSSKWDGIIRMMAPFLKFKDERTGEPLEFHSHMLRDTCAVEMLLAGMSLEHVSKFLTHTSIKTTEKYYAPWVKSRLQQLDDKVIAAMREMGATVST